MMSILCITVSLSHAPCFLDDDQKELVFAIMALLLLPPLASFL